MSMSSPFDLRQLKEAQSKAPAPPEPVFVAASDGVQLAVRVYEPKERVRGILVFYHGGGAHSAAGYPLLARGLASHYYGIKVYTPDLRGHGQSKGPRGDAPSPDQVYQDIEAVIAFARMENNPRTPFYLGGHSSGAGLIIQYYFAKQQTDICGYLLLSPQLGPNANVANESSSNGFASVSILPFILNGVFGILGSYPAVRFNYTAETIENDGVVGFNTVNMANAISPTDPAQQLQDMAEMPKELDTMKLWMGEKDELFDAEKVKSLYAATEIVPDATHLGILVDAHKLLGPWLLKNVEALEARMQEHGVDLSKEA